MTDQRHASKALQASSRPAQISRPLAKEQDSEPCSPTLAPVEAAFEVSEMAPNAQLLSISEQAATSPVSNINSDKDQYEARLVKPRKNTRSSEQLQEDLDDAKRLIMFLQDQLETLSRWNETLYAQNQQLVDKLSEALAKATETKMARRHIPRPFFDGDHMEDLADWSAMVRLWVQDLGDLDDSQQVLLAKSCLKGKAQIAARNMTKLNTLEDLLHNLALDPELKKREKLAAIAQFLSLSQGNTPTAAFHHQIRKILQVLDHPGTDALTRAKVWAAHAEPIRTALSASSKSSAGQYADVDEILRAVAALDISH